MKRRRAEAAKKLRGAERRRRLTEVLVAAIKDRSVRALDSSSPNKWRKWWWGGRLRRRAAWADVAANLPAEAEALFDDKPVRWGAVRRYTEEELRHWTLAEADREARRRTADSSVRRDLG